MNNKVKENKNRPKTEWARNVQKLKNGRGRTLITLSVFSRFTPNLNARRTTPRANRKVKKIVNRLKTGHKIDFSVAGNILAFFSFQINCHGQKKHLARSWRPGGPSWESLTRPVKKIRIFLFQCRRRKIIGEWLRCVWGCVGVGMEGM